MCCFLQNLHRDQANCRNSPFLLVGNSCSLAWCAFYYWKFSLIAVLLLWTSKSKIGTLTYPCLRMSFLRRLIMCKEDVASQTVVNLTPNWVNRQKTWEICSAVYTTGSKASWFPGFSCMVVCSVWAASPGLLYVARVVTLPLSSPSLRGRCKRRFPCGFQVLLCKICQHVSLYRSSTEHITNPS